VTTAAYSFRRICIVRRAFAYRPAHSPLEYRHHNKRLCSNGDGPTCLTRDFDLACAAESLSKLAENSASDPGSGRTAIDWPTDIHAALRAAQIRQVCHVPDGGRARLITACVADPDIECVTLTTEEEGVAQTCGAWLGGDRCVLLMQSSGVGNCINMLSIVRTCAFPFLTLVSMRGQWGELVPWQIPLAQATPTVRTAMGVIVQSVGEPDKAKETVPAAAKLAFEVAPLSRSCSSRD
jgi:sulfopyruvate decarboxylase TPP-binding subunit